jgi:hypothetical protein
MGTVPIAVKRLDAEVEGNAVGALRRWRHDDLQVDAGGIHVGQAHSQVHHVGTAVGILLAVQRLGVVGREMRQRHLRQIHMRLRQGKRLRNHHVGMHVDGDAAGPHVATGAAMFASGGSTIVISLVRHSCFLIHELSG